MRVVILASRMKIDNHWGELFKAAMLSTILSIGSEVGSGADNGNNMAVLQALRLGVANSLNQTDSKSFAATSTSSRP